MAFWKRAGRSQEQDGLNALDRATKSMAVSASRRGFLKKLPALGAGLGLGLGATHIARANDCVFEFRDSRKGCGTCGSNEEKVVRQKRCCITTPGGTEVCDPWQDTSSFRCNFCIS